MLLLVDEVDEDIAKAMCEGQEERKRRGEATRLLEPRASASPFSLALRAKATQDLCLLSPHNLTVHASIMRRRSQDPLRDRSKKELVTMDEAQLSLQASIDESLVERFSKSLNLNVRLLLLLLLLLSSRVSFLMIMMCRSQSLRPRVIRRALAVIRFRCVLARTLAQSRLSKSWMCRDRLFLLHRPC